MFCFLIIYMKVEDVCKLKLCLFLNISSDQQELMFCFKKLDICPFSAPLSLFGSKQHLRVSSSIRSVTRPRHRGGRMRWFHSPLREWQRRALAQCLASWLSKTDGTFGDRPPSGVCHWISLTAWWEVRRLSFFLTLCVNDLDLQRLASTPPSSPPLYPPLSLLFSLLISLYISQSGLKIDENLLWDYVLWAANNVEEPPGLTLPKQRCNKARSWEIHGYLMETEASELLCYIYR